MSSYLCQRVTLAVFAWCHRGHSSAWCSLGVVCRSYLCQIITLGSYLCVCMVPLWTLVSVVFAECCLSGSYLSGGCMAPSWGVVIVGTRQRGVHWVLFVRVTFVRELCQGVTFVFAWCHRGVLSSWYVVFTSSPGVDYYRDVTFVRELCQGVSFMFASCHRGYSSA